MSDLRREEAGRRSPLAAIPVNSTTAAPRTPHLLLLALIAAGIVYGTLYPFVFRPPAAPLVAMLRDAWAASRAGRGDLLANVFLFLPFGLAATAALPGRWPGLLRVLLAVLGGALLSTAVEVGQLFVERRSSNLWDVVANTGGAGLGALLVALAGPAPQDADDPPPRVIEPMAGLLVLAWLGYRLYPYLPAIDLPTWRENLLPLVLQPIPDPQRLLRLAISWLAAALLAEAAVGRRAAGLLVPLGLAGALAAEIAIPGKRLTVEEALAIALALPAWALLRGAIGRRWLAWLLALLLAALLLAERLEPFAFAAGPLRPFGWMPFRSVVAGSWEAGMQAVLLKLFLHGALLWWMLRAGLGLPVAAGAQALATFAASHVQTHLPGRSAEVTDTLLVLGLALVFRLLPPRRGPAPVPVRPVA